MRKLLIGSGRRKPTGFVRLDSNPDVDPDIVATLPPLPDLGKWNHIEAVHFIEHLALWDARALFRQIHSALDDGGTFATEQPDIIRAAETICGLRSVPRGQTISSYTMWPLFGDPTHEDASYCHRWGWCPATLIAELQQAGFASAVQAPAQHHKPGRDFRIEATK